MRILFLYSEVAEYFLACAETLHKQFGVEVHIVRWPVNPEAPFQFREYEGIHFYERAEWNGEKLWALYTRLKPDLVYLTGWMDKGYRKIAKAIKKQGIPVVCAMDNPWRGNLRQHLASLLARHYLKKRFTHIWVPGVRQYEFARRLGFAPSQIRLGMYSADLPAFHQAWHSQQTQKQQAYPHRLLYVGRFVAHKGILELIEAFISLQSEMKHDWHLKLVGAGPLKEQLKQHPQIDILDFVQPAALPALAADTGAFVLPSQYEPWGVVVHEFAGAGLPLVCTEACGAGTAFLRPGFNGFLAAESSVPSLKAALRRLFQQTDQQLFKMGQGSYQLSQQISPQTWATTLMSLVHAESFPEAAAVSPTYSST